MHRWPRRLGAGGKGGVSLSLGTEDLSGLGFCLLGGWGEPTSWDFVCFVFVEVARKEVFLSLVFCIHYPAVSLVSVKFRMSPLCRMSAGYRKLSSGSEGAF